MEIKKASMQDLEQIMHVYKNARKFMCEMEMKNNGEMIILRQN